MNASSVSEAARGRLRRALVSVLFTRRLADMLVRTWLAEFEAACLNQTLQREKTLSEEVEALNPLAAAVREGGKLEAMTVAGFGRQSLASDHLNLITLHSAKGQEFDVVLMMGMDQGKIPSWSSPALWNSLVLLRCRPPI